MGRAHSLVGSRYSFYQPPLARQKISPHYFPAFLKKLVIRKLSDL
jgi:hypothetical protein